jgi:hypothetical protein
LATGSHTTYANALKHWVAFTVSCGYPVADMGQTRVREFVSYLSLKELSIGSIEVALKAIQWIQNANGIQMYPTDSMIPLLLRGARNLHRIVEVPDTRGPRSPILASHLRRMRCGMSNRMRTGYSPLWETWTAILLAWHGVLRISEYTGPGAEENKLSPLQDSSGRYILKIARSKTDQAGVGAVVPIAVHPAADICFIKTYQLLLNLRPIPTPHLFVGPDGVNSMSRIDFANSLNAFLRSAAISQTHYSSHSLRRGGATSKFLSGISTEIIRRLGRWSPNSTTHLQYISPSTEVALATPYERCANPFAIPLPVGRVGPEATPHLMIEDAN